MRSRLTSLRSRSATAITAFTAISAIGRWQRLTILEESVVIAVCTRGSTSSTEYSNASAALASCSCATEHARSKPSAIRIGWMPRSSSVSACSRRAPARTTTPVVPSPISLSCERLRSTSSFAIWWPTCICSRIVAPSFEIVTSPSGDESILSMPLGPSEVRSTLHTDLAACRGRAPRHGGEMRAVEPGKAARAGAAQRARAGAVAAVGRRRAYLNVGLLRLKTLEALVARALAHDDKGPPILVEDERHTGCGAASAEGQERGAGGDTEAGRATASRAGGGAGCERGERSAMGVGRKYREQAHEPPSSARRVAGELTAPRRATRR